MRTLRQVAVLLGLLELLALGCCCIYGAHAAFCLGLVVFDLSVAWLRVLWGMPLFLLWGAILTWLLSLLMRNAARYRHLSTVSLVLFLLSGLGFLLMSDSPGSTLMSLIPFGVVTLVWITWLIRLSHR